MPRRGFQYVPGHFDHEPNYIHPTAWRRLRAAAAQMDGVFNFELIDQLEAIALSSRWKSARHHLSIALFHYAGMKASDRDAAEAAMESIRAQRSFDHLLVVEFGVPITWRTSGKADDVRLTFDDARRLSAISIHRNRTLSENAVRSNIKSQLAVRIEASTSNDDLRKVIRSAAHPTHQH